MIYNKDEVEKMISDAGSLFGFMFNEGSNKESIKEALNGNKDELNKIILGSGGLLQSILKDSLKKESTNEYKGTDEDNGINEEKDTSNEETSYEPKIPFLKDAEILGESLGQLIGSLIEGSPFTFEYPEGPVETKKELPFKVDIEEFDDRYEVKAELAGYRKALISAKFNQSVLTITAKSNEVYGTEEFNYLLKEIDKKDVARSFELPFVNKSSILASFEDGILNVTLFKTKEKDTTKVISIK